MYFKHPLSFLPLSFSSRNNHKFSNNYPSPITSSNMVNDHITSAQVVIKTHGLEQGASMICSVRWFEALGCSARLRPNDRTSRHAFGDFSNVYMDQSCLRTARLWWTLQNSLPLYSERVDVCNHVGVQMQSRYVLSLFWRLENMQSLVLASDL